MNNQVLQDGTVTYYAVVLNGNVISGKFTDRSAAEAAKRALALTPEQQTVAEVVVVDAGNRQLLLG